jgi:cytosine/adenosine deaminase-related metal-dependent hydrolase
LNTFRAKAVLTPEGLLDDAVVQIADDGAIVAVRGATPADPPALDGLILPGLVNAHTHLELSGLEGRVPGGEGLTRWVGKLIRERKTALTPEERVQTMRDAAGKLAAYGTMGVSDINNGADSGEALVEHGVSGIVQWELLTLDAQRLPLALWEAAEPHREVRGERGAAVVRPCPHAPYSTAPALIRACVKNSGTRRAPASLHIAEDREELAFVRDGSGAWAHFLDRAGVDWRWWQAPGGTPVEMLDQLGVLGPDLLLVHGVHLTPRDRSLLAKSGTPLVLCPRSNEHIGGELPDVPALLRTGVRLALGTDSLGSCPDLDVLGDAALLREAFPDVDPVVWLQLATRGGAEALALDLLGGIAVGKKPGLVLFEGVRSADELLGAVSSVPRRILAQHGVA